MLVITCISHHREAQEADDEAFFHMGERNDPPEDGFEYIAARVQFELLTMAGDKALDLHALDFQAISSTGREYEDAVVVEPAPAIGANLYAGATHEGWVVFQVAKDDTAPVMTYGRTYDGTGGIWFTLKAK